MLGAFGLVFARFDLALLLRSLKYLVVCVFNHYFILLVALRGDLPSNQRVESERLNDDQD